MPRSFVETVPGQDLVIVDLKVAAYAVVRPPLTLCSGFKRSLMVAYRGHRVFLCRKFVGVSKYEFAQVVPPPPWGGQWRWMPEAFAPDEEQSGRRPQSAELWRGGSLWLREMGAPPLERQLSVKHDPKAVHEELICLVDVFARSIHEVEIVGSLKQLRYKVVSV